MIDRVPLNSLKFFYYVAEYGSVSVAAEKLFLTQSAVSKQIKNLEQMLEVPLFDRINKTLLLTAEGKTLYSCCQQIFAQLNQCLEQIQQKKSFNRPLVLSCEPTLSMKWLIPRLAQIAQLNWGFDVVLQTGGGSVNFNEQQIDLALRRDDFSWGVHLYSEKLADEYMVLIHQPQADSQQFLWSTSRPHFDQQLLKHREINAMIHQYPWVALDHFYLCLEGCLAGLGATLISVFMVEKELQHHTVQAKLPVFADGSAYHLLSATPFAEDPRKLVFMQWLKQEMSATQQMIQSLELG